MPSESITIKQGDTIRWACVWRAGGVPVNLTGYQIQGHVRTSGDVLVAALTITPGDQGTAPGTFEAFYADTSAVPVGSYAVDFRVRQPDADSYSTQTFRLAVTADNTPRW